MHHCSPVIMLMNLPTDYYGQAKCCHASLSTQASSVLLALPPITVHNVWTFLLYQLNKIIGNQILKQQKLQKFYIRWRLVKRIKLTKSQVFCNVVSDDLCLGYCIVYIKLIFPFAGPVPDVPPSKVLL